MICPDTYRHHMLIVAATVVIAVSGCAGNWSVRQSRPAPMIEKPDAPVMTAAQREQQFNVSYREGLRLVGGRQYGLALGAFEKAIALRPDSIDALFNLGACHEAIGDPMRAVGVYRRILKIAPNDPDCYFNLGTSYIKMYHRAKSPTWRRLARESWKRSLELNPDQPDARQFLAMTGSRD